MTKLVLLMLAVGAAVLVAGMFMTQSTTRAAAPEASKAGGVGRVVKSDAEWRRILTPQQYEITREKGTEPAFSGKYHNHKAKGVYTCVACGLELFDSRAKFDSHTGWPSFYQPIAAGHVADKADNSFFMRRTEVLCARCDAHLGHVFKDGPPPTGLRYCINSAALNFVPASEAKP